MRIRVVALAVLAVALAAVAFTQWHRAPVVEPAPARAAKTGAADLDTLFDWHAVQSLAEARSMLADAYRLAPDGRFLRAVADVPRLAGARSPGGVRAFWRDGRWVVRCGADTVGSLPEYPSYADARALLAAWAARWPQAGASAPQVRGSVADPFGTLTALDARWKAGERNGALDAEGAEALAWLAFANAGDRTRSADVIAARALAALALAGVAGGPAPRTHVLLARVMGYEREAAGLAAALPASDPLRMWALRDTAALARAAEATSGTLESRLLDLHALAQEQLPDAWLDAFERFFPERGQPQRFAIATGLTLQEFVAADSVAPWTAFAAALETQRWAHTDTAAVRRAFAGRDIPRAFERLLLANGPRAGGPLLDADLVRAHTRAQLYTALAIYGLHLSRTLFDEDGARDYAAALGPPGDGPAGEFAQWYDDLVNTTWHGDRPRPAIAVHLVQATTLAPEELCESFELAAPIDRAWTPLLTRSLVHRMDTRPEDRAWLAWIAIAEELFVPDRERLLEASAATGDVGGAISAMWLAAMRGDDDELVRRMASPDVSVSAKCRMLTLLEDAAQPVERLNRCAGAAVSVNPQETSLPIEWAKGLELHHDRRHARILLERWLDQRGEHASELGVGAILARIARAYRAEGMPQRAWTVVQLDSTGMFAMQEEQALTLDALGQTAYAFEVAGAAARRYAGEPGPSGLLARLEWANGRDTLAARALTPTLASPDFWRWTLGPQFVEQFQGRPREALEAVRVMAHVFGPSRSVLQNLASAYQDAGDAATGFEVETTIMGGGTSRMFDLVNAYDMAKQARGRDQALAWFTSMPSGAPIVREFAVETGVAYGHDELAWLDSLPSSPKDRDWSLLVRAPGFTALQAGDSRRAAMARELHAREGSYYLALARYVAEGGDPSGVLRFADEPRRRAEVFFWVGRRAEIEGREADAAACYQLCRETAQTHQGEWLWSHHRMLPLIEPLHRLRETRDSGTARRRAT